MQKPATYRALVLVLVLVVVLVLVKTSTVVEAGDQHEQVCIPPGANGEYSAIYNKAILPVANPLTVQGLVLESINTRLTSSFTQGPIDLCSRVKTYSDVAGSTTVDVFSYAYCGQGVDRQGCIKCLQDGAQFIKQNCGSSCYGAQASSDNCCIRFEGASFCQVTM
ncbi:hypothetical protein LINGRAHAP2_LOCUS12158 [Linum grandiflorum]